MGEQMQFAGQEGKALQPSGSAHAGTSAPQAQKGGSSQPSKHSASPTPTWEYIVDDTAPIRRTELDKVIKPLRWLGASLLIGFAAWSTINLLARDIAPATQHNGEQIAITLFGGQPLVQLNILIGFIVALAIFVLEIVLAERYPWGYRIVVGIDSWYTERQVQPWVDAIIYTNIAPILPAAGFWQTVLAFIIAQIVGWGVGWAIAYFGEVLLLGRRRKQKRPK